MGFSTFDISELPDDADEDYVIEFTTRDSKLGLTLSADEMEAIGHAITDAAGGEFESWDGHKVGEASQK